MVVNDEWNSHRKRSSGSSSSNDLGNGGGSRSSGNSYSSEKNDGTEDSLVTSDLNGVVCISGTKGQRSIGQEMMVLTTSPTGISQNFNQNIILNHNTDNNQNIN